MENYKIKEIIIDMDRKNYAPITLKQGEVNGTRIKAKLIYNSLEFNPSNITECKVFYNKPDCKTVIQDNVPYNTNNIVEFTIPTQVSVINGQGEMEIALYSNDNKTISSVIPLIIDKSILGGVEDSIDQWGILDKAFDLANNADKINQDENERVQNETIRVANENTRIGNENKRLSDENTRKTNEDIRISNETKREALYESLTQSKNNYDKAVEEGNNGNLEIIAAREDKHGKTYNTIGERLDNLDDTSLVPFSTSDNLTKLENLQEGYLSDVVVKGRTLVNLLPNTSKWSTTQRDGTTITKDNNKIIWSVTKELTEHAMAYIYTPIVKTSTIYTFIANIEKNTLDKDFVLLDGYSEINIPTQGILIKKGEVGKKIITITTKNILENPRVCSFIPKGTTTGELIISNFMILEGDYTENSPSYFEGIKSVGEVNYLDGRYIGNNLFNGKYEKKFIQGGDDKNRLLDNLDTRSVIIPIELGAQYSVKKHSESNRFTICLYNSLDIGTEATQGIDTSKSSLQVTFTNTSNSKYMVVYVSSSKEEPLLMVEKGENFSEYEPYYEGSKIEILSKGKNLIETFSSVDSSGLTHSFDYNGDLELIVKDGNAMWLNTKFQYNNIEPYTDYIVSYNDVIGDSDNVVVGLKSVVGNTEIRHLGDLTLNEKEKVIRLQAGEKLNVRCYTSTLTPKSVGYKRIIKGLKIEKGAISTLYEPYKSNKIGIILKEPLRELPNGVVDIINADGILTRNIKTSILNGIENWRLTNIKENTIAFEITLVDGISPSNSSYSVISNKFSTNTGDVTFHEDIECIGLSVNSVLRIRISKTKLITQDIAGFKKWLSENNTIIYYEKTATTLEESKPLTIRTFKDGYIEQNMTIPSVIEGEYPITLGGSIQSNINAIDKIEEELGGIWRILLNLADKELQMLSVEPLVGTDDISKKVNEILNIWR